MPIERLFSIGSLVPPASVATGIAVEDLLPGLSEETRYVVLGLWLQKLVEYGNAAVDTGLALWGSHAQVGTLPAVPDAALEVRWRRFGTAVLQLMREAAQR